jgi:NAD(P)-dependent dehydrogenase (short-subunit alcohol dehydrogenase family)
MSTPAGSAAPLQGRVALVAGSSRGAGRGKAVALGEAAATVYCTGRTTGDRRSEYDLPETIDAERFSAFYDLAKTSVIRLAFAQSVELAPHGCTAVALTPGWLRSEMMLENYGVTEENWRDGAAVNPHFAAISESPLYVGRAVAAHAADPNVQRLNGGSFSSGGLAREYGFTDVDGSQPDAWRYMVEVQEPGLPADPAGYR